MWSGVTSTVVFVRMLTGQPGRRDNADWRTESGTPTIRAFGQPEHRVLCFLKLFECNFQHFPKNIFTKLLQIKVAYYPTFYFPKKDFF